MLLFGKRGAAMTPQDSMYFISGAGMERQGQLPIGLALLPFFL